MAVSMQLKAVGTGILALPSGMTSRLESSILGRLSFFCFNVPHFGGQLLARVTVVLFFWQSPLGGGKDLKAHW